MKSHSLKTGKLIKKTNKQTNKQKKNYFKRRSSEEKVYFSLKCKVHVLDCNTYMRLWQCYYVSQ